MLKHILLLLAAFVAAGWCIVLWRRILLFLSRLHTAIAVAWRIICGKQMFIVALDADSKSSTQFEGEIYSDVTNKNQFEAIRQALDIYRTWQTLVDYINESQTKND